MCVIKNNEEILIFCKGNGFSKSGFGLAIWNKIKLHYEN
jgi:hypothetical protein